jgi:hypothetical protein
MEEVMGPEGFETLRLDRLGCFSIALNSKKKIKKKKSET